MMNPSVENYWYVRGGMNSLEGTDSFLVICHESLQIRFFNVFAWHIIPVRKETIG